MATRFIAHICIVLVLMAGLLFGLAGTFAWFGAYMLLAVFGIGGIGMAAWLAHNDPALLKERMGRGSKEKPLFDRIILPLTNIVLFGWIALMALDMRWHGPSGLPPWASLLGGAAILAAFALVVRVMAENTFATSFVRAQPERGHKVIDTGPYGFVRHPMYTAAVLAYAAIPVALGSRSGMIGIALPVLLIAIRIPFEEKLLLRELPGYGDYMTRVRFRLVPLIW